MAEIIIRGVDGKLRNAFRIWCLERGSTMKGELVKFMQRKVGDSKKGS